MVGCAVSGIGVAEGVTRLRVPTASQSTVSNHEDENDDDVDDGVDDDDGEDEYDPIGIDVWHNIETSDFLRQSLAFCVW